jgi:ketosteroid isomerase-like protein
VTSDATGVAAANLAFYRALEARDLSTMGSIWLQDESASCVHPGWHRLDGWDEIQRSWENIFANSRPWTVSCEDVRIAVAGDLAWVTCVEVIVPFGAEEGRTPPACRRPISSGGWTASGASLHHHASPSPTETVMPEEPIN